MAENIHSDQPSDYQSDLRSQRPDLRKRHLYCVKCRKEPHAMESTAMHRGTPDGQGLTGNGVILARVKCHGELLELAIGFREASQLIDSGEKIPVFDGVNQWEPKRIIRPPGYIE
jgi:hypothetical protein